MKKLLILKFLCVTLLFFCLPKFSFSQHYIELAKLSYGTAYGTGFENTRASQTIKSLDASITYPFKISKQTAIIVGLDYGNYQLSLFPNEGNKSLTYLRFKAGINQKYSDRWSASYILLPKFAAEDLSINKKSFFVGGLALVKFQKSDHFQYRFGAYGSSEGFGTIATPILGWYYLSKNGNWESTVNLPINGDINYRISSSNTIGFGFKAPVRSFILDTENRLQDHYAQANIIELGFYAEHSFMDKSLIFRIKGGYTSISYEVFEEGDKLPVRISAFEFGDDRTQLNPQMEGGFFANLEIFYRFNLKKNNH